MSCPDELPNPGPRPATEPPQWVHDSLTGITEIRGTFKPGQTTAYEPTYRPDFPDSAPPPACPAGPAKQPDSHRVRGLPSRTRPEERHAHVPRKKENTDE